MTTRDRANSTILAPVDLADQPVGKYIFLIDTVAGGRQAFSVDDVYIGETAAYGRDECGRQIVVVPLNSGWTVLARDMVIFRTLEESMQKQKADQESERALVKELYPELPNAKENPDKMPSGTVPTLEGHYL